MARPTYTTSAKNPRTCCACGENTIAWTPVAGDVHAMLDGTSLFELGTVTRVLAHE